MGVVSPTQRGRVLKKAAEIMRERNRELSELETLDTGKPIQETIVADPTSGADSLEFFGGIIASALNGSHIPLGGDFAYTKRVPLGVVVGIGAWNYPQQIACWKAAPALACGNAMVFKPSEVTPLGALKIAEILIEAGLPKACSTSSRATATPGRCWSRIPTWPKSRSPAPCRPAARWQVRPPAS